jgi:hypothetical protein
VASALGLFLDSAYDMDDATVSMLRGYDAVTLAVVVPLLAFLQSRSGAGRLPALRCGLLAYLLYSYLFGALAGGFGVAFLVDVGVVASSTLALMASVPALTRTPGAVGRAARISAGALALLAFSLGAMWLAASVQAADDGTTPAGSVLVESDLVVRLGIVLDLWLLVPLYAVAAALLWRGRPHGATLALVAGVSGLLHQISYLAAMWFQVEADVPDARAFDPFEPVIIACYLVILLPLLWRQRIP